jgi:hypothetical protein
MFLAPKSKTRKCILEMLNRIRSASNPNLANKLACLSPAPLLYVRRYKLYFQLVKHTYE